MATSNHLREDNMLTFDKPYTIETKRVKYWLLGWGYEYHIMFEDASIMSSIDYDNMKTVTAALNGAYNLGKWDERTRNLW